MRSCRGSVNRNSSEADMCESMTQFSTKRRRLGAHIQLPDHRRYLRRVWMEHAFKSVNRPIPNLDARTTDPRVAAAMASVYIAPRTIARNMVAIQLPNTRPKLCQSPAPPDNPSAALPRREQPVSEYPRQRRRRPHEKLTSALAAMLVTPYSTGDGVSRQSFDPRCCWTWAQGIASLEDASKSASLRPPCLSTV